jgi:hypothetical protein
VRALYADHHRQLDRGGVAEIAGQSVLWGSQELCIQAAAAGLDRAGLDGGGCIARLCVLDPGRHPDSL